LEYYFTLVLKTKVSNVVFQSVLSKCLSLAEMSIKGEIFPPTLYVYETVDLELSLQEGEEETHHIALHAGTAANSFCQLKDLGTVHKRRPHIIAKNRPPPPCPQNSRTGSYPPCLFGHVLNYEKSKVLHQKVRTSASKKTPSPLSALDNPLDRGRLL